MGVEDSNEVEILAILELLRLFKSSFHAPLMVESASCNVLSWVLNSTRALEVLFLSQ